MGLGVSKEDIDIACRNGLNWPQGPFELPAELGTEVLLDMGHKLYAEKGECYSLPTNLEQLI